MLNLKQMQSVGATQCQKVVVKIHFYSLVSINLFWVGALSSESYKIVPKYNEALSEKIEEK